MSQPQDHLSPSLGGHATPSDAPRLGGDAALTHLVGALGDPNPAVRQRAIEGLEAIGGERVFALLISALSDDEPSVVQRSARALGWYSDQRAEDALIALMHQSTNDVVCAEAIRSLGMVGGQTSARLLRAIFHQDRSLRTPLGRALRQLAERDVSLFSDYVMDQLDVDHSAQVFEFLRAARPAGLLPRLEQIASDDANPYRRRIRALRALGAIGNPNASPVLVELLADSNADIGRWAANALRTVRDRDSIPSIAALLKHSDTAVRARAVKVLGSRKLIGAVPVLIEALQDNSLKVRRAAVRALARIHTEEAIPPIVEALSDRSTVVQYEAALILANRRHPAVIPALLRYLREGTQAMRHKAVGLLNRLYYEQSLPVADYREQLEAFQDDPDNRVRMTINSILHQRYIR